MNYLVDNDRLKLLLFRHLGIQGHDDRDGNYSENGHIQIRVVSGDRLIIAFFPSMVYSADNPILLLWEILPLWSIVVKWSLFGKYSETSPETDLHFDYTPTWLSLNRSCCSTQLNNPEKQRQNHAADQYYKWKLNRIELGFIPLFHQLQSGQLFTG